MQDKETGNTRSAMTLECDQAIFTSVRTPMGEGYRIIASSRGLRPEEKQAITRNSPSHESLCATDTKDDVEASIQAVAFYALPTKRLCVACSLNAGAEHTGRGGQRVYTHSVIFEPKECMRWAYNPFAILRAMQRAGLAQPQLTPPSVLEPLDLAVGEPVNPVPQMVLTSLLKKTCRAHVLNSLLNGHSLIINIPQHWLEVAEALILGLPGPMRPSVSFSAGLRFSTGRCHLMSLAHDDNGSAKSRVVGKQIEYVDPTDQEIPPVPDSPWVAFVERHWNGGDLDTLARRTSLEFANFDEPARHRIGLLYQAIDTARQAETVVLLAAVARHLHEPDCGVEADITAELLIKTQEVLMDRLCRLPWEKVADHFQTIAGFWRQSEEGRLFAEPLIGRLLEVAIKQHPLDGAQAGLVLARNTSTPVLTQAAARFDEILQHVAEWAQNARDDELGRLFPLYQQWRAILPQAPALDLIQRRCERIGAVQAISPPA